MSPGPSTTLPTPTSYGRPANLIHAKSFTFSLDSDIYLACEDQATNSGMTLDKYLQVVVNDALRMLLCG